MGIGQFFKSFLEGGKVDVASRYEILREAVSGTMSNFNMARDRETDKIVGLKVLDKAKTDALEARFKGLKKPTEGEIATSFNHPRIVETFSHGITTNDEQFLVMEFLDGPGSQFADHRPQQIARWQPANARAAGGRSAGGGARSGLHPSRHLPAKLRLLERRQLAEADRLRPHVAGGKGIYAAGQSHGHAELHGAGSGAPEADGSAARYFRVWRFDVRAVCVRAAVAARRHRPGGHDPRPKRSAAAAEVLSEDQSDAGSGDPQVHGSGAGKAVSIDHAVSKSHFSAANLKDA